MSVFLFVDESGQDRHESPYEVLAGVAVEDRDLWNLVKALRAAEEEYFGTRYTQETQDGEWKAKKLLKSKTFRLAAQMDLFLPEERRQLAQSCLRNGGQAGRSELTALAQAKIGYVSEALAICARFRCKAFASVVDPNAPRPKGDHLRKDYAFLFERFYNYLDDVAGSGSGIVVFDELEKSQSHLLIDQMERYFLHTVNGRQRADRIIPEPFFVHSDLTTGVQLADLVAYIISWGLRLPKMQGHARSELTPYARQVERLGCASRRRGRDHRIYQVSSLTYITDLRGRDDR